MWLFDECLENSVNFMYLDAGTSGALERGSTGPVDGVMHSFVGRACLRCMDRWNESKNVADCTGIEIFSPNDSRKHSQECGCCLIIFQNNPNPHSQKVRDDLHYTLTLAGGARQVSTNDINVDSVKINVPSSGTTERLYLQKESAADLLREMQARSSSHLHLPLDYCTRWVEAMRHMAPQTLLDLQGSKETVEHLEASLGSQSPYPVCVFTQPWAFKSLRADARRTADCGDRWSFTCYIAKTVRTLGRECGDADRAWVSWRDASSSEGTTRGSGCGVGPELPPLARVFAGRGLPPHAGNLAALREGGWLARRYEVGDPLRQLEAALGASGLADPHECGTQIFTNRRR